MSKYKLSRYVEMVNFVENDIEKVLIFNCANGKFSIISNNVWEQIQGEQYDKIPKQFIEDFFVSEDVDEFELVQQENENFNSKTLYFSPMVSGTCNFGCDYCGQNHRNIKLSVENQDLILQHIERQLQTKKFNSVEIGWFGGEPLTAFDVIENMSPKLKQLAAKENVKYTATITTNGSLLTEEISRKCIEEFCVKVFCITIDGDEEEHNARRCLKGGQGTFHDVYKNLKTLLKVTDNNPKVEVALRCNVDMRNPDAIFHLIDILHADNLEKYKNLCVYLAPIHDWGNDAGKKAIEQKEFAELEIQAMARLVELGFTVKPLPKRKYGCMYTNPNSLMSDPMGNLFPCSEIGLVDTYIEDGVNKYQIGTLQEGVTCDRKVFPKYEKISQNDSPCRKCKLFPTCCGACPKQWQDDNLPCPTSKFNLKEKMMLAYLLLQKRKN